MAQSPTLGDEERPIQIHRACALPGGVWHGQEFSEGAYPDIANEYICRWSVPLVPERAGIAYLYGRTLRRPLRRSIAVESMSCAEECPREQSVPWLK